jgi:hypothetical protein
MLGIVTTKATLEKQPVYSRVQLNASTDYIINTDNIIKLSLYGTNDSLVRYSWNIHDDQRVPDEFIVDQTNAAIQALADVSANSNMVALKVFEDILSFAAAASLTSVTRYFNITDIVWVEESSGGQMCKMIVAEKGFNEKGFIVDYNMDQFMDLVTGGATTTSTTTTTAAATTTAAPTTTSTTTAAPTTTTSTTTSP